MYGQTVAVVGAGPAGVSVAVALKDRGVTPMLIDRADQEGRHGGVATTGSN
jgi:2-polyprenyl-6-methoxyphenol hydroxylase-like FAD-dependent oxidoreductase